MQVPARKSTSSPSCRRSRLARGKEVLQQSANAIRALADSLEEDFLVAVDKILATRGSVLVCGIGKAGLVGRKISATFASTGTRSHFLHPAEAVHGDLGCIGPNDVLLVLSNSGATEEIVRLLPYMSRKSAGIIAITSGANSPLARAADVSLILPACREACRHNLAPSTSTTAMLAMGDSLALVVSETREFTMDDFAELHPGGSLGRKLASVDEAMRPASECRIAPASQSLRQTLIEVARPGRRTGAVMLVDDQRELVGIFTDSDLAKLLEHRRDSALDAAASDLMSKNCTSIQTGARLSEAIDLMVHRKISELPVVDNSNRPIGMIDITDVLEIQRSQHTKTPATRPSAPPSPPEDEMDEDWDDGDSKLRIFGPSR